MRQRPDPHRCLRRRAGRARARGHELHELPAGRCCGSSRSAWPQADIVWNRAGNKSVAYDGRAMTFTGPWDEGPIQKVIVAMLALRMEAVGLHPSHSSAVRYRDQHHPVPGRRVEPRQVDGSARGQSPRRPARLNRDHRHRRERRGRDGLKGRVPQEARQGHRAGRQGGAQRGCARSSSARCPRGKWPAGPPRWTS